MHSYRTDVLIDDARPRKALSIRQPWAWAVLYAGKRVENRTWYTSYRGRIFIHAGLIAQREAVHDLRADILAVAAPRPPAVCGALIGTASVVDCVRPELVANEQSGWTMGPWCFVLDDVRPLVRPIPYQGNLGFFAVDADKVPI